MPTNGGLFSAATIMEVLMTTPFARLSTLESKHLHSGPESAADYSQMQGKVVRTFTSDPRDPNLPHDASNVNPEGNNYGPILQMRNLKEGEGVLINSSNPGGESGRLACPQNASSATSSPVCHLSP